MDQTTNLVRDQASRNIDSADAGRFSTLWRVAIALIPIAYLILVGAWAGFDNLVSRLANDDQSYYILVARNLFVRGPTYDGLYLTNGVHPLFACILGAIYRVLTFPWSQLALVSIITCVLFGSVFLYVVLGIRRIKPSTVLGIALLMSSLAVYPILYRGMEGSLAIMVIALYLTVVARGKGNLWQLGALSVALWASRLELLVLPLIVAVLAGKLIPLRRAYQNRLIWGWLISVAAFGLYFLASYKWLGLALPVSGLIKQSSTFLLPYFAILGTSFLLMSSMFPVLPRLRMLASKAWMTHSLVTFASVFYLAHVFGQRDAQSQTWYYFPIPAVVAFALIELEVEISTLVRRFAIGTIVTVSIVATFWEVFFVIPVRGESWKAMQSITDRAKKTALPGERFMGPGWIAMLIGPEFEPFSSDGLVGGVEQYHAVKEGRLMSFAYQSGVRFVFTASAVNGTAAVPPNAPMWDSKLISEGLVPTGRSLWGSLDRADMCGLRRCSRIVAVYRLSAHQ